ncbi:hypothetical protein [Meiothermus rufus]|uniref:hypothetical protein n=1 Tax=Meiothermus rufus TaxID=604332 RepID=UPI001FE017F8|nr:hypothetical protein [Meiothermus rufus]
MSLSEKVWRSIGQGRAHPSDVLNILIELDNRKGQVGLWALENELRSSLPRLRPQSRLLAAAWLEATVLYRTTYYPESQLSRLFSRLVKADSGGRPDLPGQGISRSSGACSKAWAKASPGAPSPR